MAQSAEKPHILNASSNVRRMQKQLAGVLDPSALARIEQEICANVTALYRLGKSHYYFGRRQRTRAWRQKVSRLYYGAFNARRAVNLFTSGLYNTDSSDHQAKLPKDFPRKETFETRLMDLRADRNLADYDHVRSVSDLLYTPADHELLVSEFIDQVKLYLNARNVNVK